MGKEDGRVSEASRRVAHEEEERLILQKNPLQKKLAEISMDTSHIFFLISVILLLRTESFGEEAYICFSYLAVAKFGLKNISNDVERCLSLVRFQLLVHWFAYST